MSTRRTYQNCEISQSYCKFGSEAILKWLEGFQENVDGVIKNEDIECVHKTRVASRRLRAAMPLFMLCFPRKSYKRWLKKIKKVTCLLGSARDLDVQILFIEQYMEKLEPSQKASMKLLLKNYKDCRSSIQPTVVKGLEKLKASQTLLDIDTFCQQTITHQSNVTFDPNQVLEKAQWHISFRLDDFLSMQEYVYLENEKLKHHQMRIYAKKLRYTMETFSPLYKSQLKEEIEIIKEFQDALGEMHDYDVWTEYIEKHIQETKKGKPNGSKIDNPTVQHFISFSEYVKQKRKERYNHFIHLWEASKKADFFDKLRRVTQSKLTLVEEKIQQSLTDPSVKVAVLSDIHGNLDALKAVLADAEAREVAVFLNAGDSVGYGPYPNEVLKLLCEKNVASILGNYDLEVMDPKAQAKGKKNIALKFAREELTKSCKGYLNSLPHELRLEVASKKLLVTHGSPVSIEEHIYPDTATGHLESLAKAAHVDVIIVGHSHEQFHKETSGACFVNPGSVGRPNDENPQTAYAILTFDPFKVELIRLDYPVEDAAAALRKKGLPESFAQMLLRGVSLDAVEKGDNAKIDLMANNCQAVVESTKKFLKKCWPDTEHPSQVTKLSLELFDSLVNVHKLEKCERCWLECAAILHDIGLSQNRAAHHKSTANLILNDTTLPFSSHDRRVIASVARYHRKGLPKKKHYNLLSLDSLTVHKVRVLASLLRVADSLDYTHGEIVKSLTVKESQRGFTVECASEVKSLLEEQAFNKKKDLFEKVFNKKLVLVWKQT